MNWMYQRGWSSQRVPTWAVGLGEEQEAALQPENRERVVLKAERASR